MRRSVRLGGVLCLCVASFAAVFASDRVPGERWMRFADPAEAGFDAAKLAGAESMWEGLPSSAFMVIADGAVVAAWGDVDRRFMCHSVRKSFLSAIFGVYWDRGEIELNRTMEEIGIEEPVDPLLPRELQARTLDLLKARSGVFHPAEYAGRTDSRPRGSEGPGQFFAYNNWDFNTLAAILKKEAGADVFEAWDAHFAKPLAMQDWRMSDGYYHYERDKSQYPAYPFRLSARDAARFGLLFAREGSWGDERVLSRDWVRRSSALYSTDDEVFGYGFMWWVALEDGEAIDLAREAPAERLVEMAGTWTYPPPPLGLPAETTFDLEVEDGHLVAFSEHRGTFRQYLQDDGWVVEEDSHQRSRPIRDESGAFTGLAGSWAIATSAVFAQARGEDEEAASRVAWIEDETDVGAAVGKLPYRAVSGDGATTAEIDGEARALVREFGARTVGLRIDRSGTLLMGAGHREVAERLFLLNTRLLPSIARTWNSLGNCRMAIGRHDDAIAAFEKVLELAPDTASAKEKIERMRAEAGP